MNQSDIITIKITDEMIKEAQDDAESLKSSIGNKTRAATEDRDITGSLAHQAVEKFLEYNKRPFESYRKIHETHGDNGDILYNGDLIDVKGTRGQVDGFFYFKNFLVFDSELPSIEKKGITHFVFVMINLPEREAYIFGAIDYEDFMEKSEPVKLKWDNHGIRAYQLKPIINYINHT